MLLNNFTIEIHARDKFVRVNRFCAMTRYNRNKIASFIVSHLLDDK